MREPSSAPAEFVSYVDRRLPALESAALRLTGDDRQAERLGRELMTLVALRWGRLSRADSRHGLAAGESADVYLTRLFRDEASEFGYPKMGLNLDFALPGRRRSSLTGAMPARDEADYLWGEARRRLRRRLLIAGVAGGVVAVGALCRPRSSPEKVVEERPLLPLVQSTELPQGALLLRGSLFGAAPIEGVPAQLEFPQKPPKLSEGPVPRAVLLAGESDAYGGVVALADDGSWREVDVAPFPAATWIAPTSLSPEGRRAVFVTPTGGVIVDLASGTAESLPGIVVATKPVWLSEQQLLVSKDAVLDLASGGLRPAPVGPEEVVTPRRFGGRAETVSELLSTGKPMTAPARVRVWNLDGGRSRPVTTPLSGHLAGLVGWWQGAGFGFDRHRVARVCRPRNLPASLPVDSIVAVLRPDTGEVVKALLIDSTVSGVPTLVGWKDESTVLFIAAAGDRQSLVAWDVERDEVGRVSTMGFVGTVALRDLTGA